MNNLNSVLIEGNLTRDPQVKEVPTGTMVCNFSIASNRYYKQNQEQHHEVSYVDVEVWAKLAEQCQEYLKKGRGVRVVGRIKQDRWEDDHGQRHSRVKIVAEHVEFKPRSTAQKERADADNEEQSSAEEVEEKSAELMEEKEEVAA